MVVPNFKPRSSAQLSVSPPLGALCYHLTWSRRRSSTPKGNQGEASNIKERIPK
jgi:hypothetical protein